MFFRTRVLFFSVILSTSVFANTTRMDNDYYAFKPRPIFAVKEHQQWVVPIERFGMGLVGDTFMVDSRLLKKKLPAGCQDTFRVKTIEGESTKDKMPPRKKVSPEWDSQMLVLKSQSARLDTCIVKVWLSSPQSYPPQTFGQITPPKTPSVVVGKIQFLHKEKDTYIEFAIGASDL